METRTAVSVKQERGLYYVDYMSVKQNGKMYNTESVTHDGIKKTIL